jgi:hypothetical protein
MQSFMIEFIDKNSLLNPEEISPTCIRYRIIPLI